jgi:hypothetical protein
MAVLHVRARPETRFEGGPGHRPHRREEAPAVVGLRRGAPGVRAVAAQGAQDHAGSVTLTRPAVRHAGSRAGTYGRPARTGVRSHRRRARRP